MIEWKENPDETDFPLIDRCVVCDGLCAWQPRYEIAARTTADKEMFANVRPLGYTPTHRVVKICCECTPIENSSLRMLIRKHYPVFAKENQI